MSAERTLRDYLTTLNSGDSAWLLYAESIAPDAACAVIQAAHAKNITQDTTPGSDWVCLGDLDSLTYAIRVAAGFVDAGEPEDDLESAWLITQAVDFLIVAWATV